MSKRRRVVILRGFARALSSIAFLSLLALICDKAAIRAQPPVKPILSISATDLPGEYNGALAGAFDLSPDGKRIAVEFKTCEGQGVWSIWIAQWDIQTKKLIAKQRVEGPTAWKEILPNPQYRLDLRFTPDGQGLIAQTGLHIKRLDAMALSPLFSISGPEFRPSASGGLAIRRFALSGDGKWLAVLSTSPTFNCRPTNTRLFNLATGEKIAEWNLLQACAKSISLSWSGDGVLLSRFDSDWPANADIVLVDSRTGKVASSVDAGYGGHGSLYGVNDAQYIGNDHFITLSNVSEWSPSSLALHSLKDWDASTGRLLHELKYSVYGIVGDSLAVAARTPIIAAITNKSDPEKIGRDDESDVSYPRLLLFHLNEEEPFYVSPNLKRPGPMDSPHTFTSPVRLSASGSVVAIMEDSVVEVYNSP